MYSKRQSSKTTTDAKIKAASPSKGSNSKGETWASSQMDVFPLWYRAGKQAIDSLKQGPVMTAADPGAVTVVEYYI